MIQWAIKINCQLSSNYLLDLQPSDCRHQNSLLITDHSFCTWSNCHIKQFLFSVCIFKFCTTVARTKMKGRIKEKEQNWFKNATAGTQILSGQHTEVICCEYVVGLDQPTTHNNKVYS